MPILVLQRSRRWRSMSLVIGIFFLFTSTDFASANLTVWVFPGVNGRMLYPADRLGNRLVDVSGAGYKNGLLPLPLSNCVPVRTNISQVAGDNRVNIQNAINYVQNLPLDANDFRGAVLLNAGDYPLSNSIAISVSGVVLRGWFYFYEHRQCAAVILFDPAAMMS